MAREELMETLKSVRNQLAMVQRERDEWANLCVRLKRMDPDKNEWLRERDELREEIEGLREKVEQRSTQLNKALGEADSHRRQVQEAQEIIQSTHESHETVVQECKRLSNELDRIKNPSGRIIPLTEDELAAYLRAALITKLEYFIDQRAKGGCTVDSVSGVVSAFLSCIECHS